MKCYICGRDLGENEGTRIGKDKYDRWKSLCGCCYIPIMRRVKIRVLNMMLFGETPEEQLRNLKDLCDYKEKYKV